MTSTSTGSKVSLASQTYVARAEKRGGGNIRLVYLDRFLCALPGMLAVPIRLPDYSFLADAIARFHKFILETMLWRPLTVS